ncbi:MAG: FxsA family protein [Pirellulales bacterium]
MLFYLFLLFTVVPVVELALLVWLGGQTVWWLPVLLVIADGLAGALLWRWQGIRTLVRIREEMAAGRMPADALVDGLLIFFAGGLLITPGMITDVAGFALLIPPIRAVVKRFAKAWFVRHVEVRTAAFYGNGSPSSRSPHSDEIIDARVIQSHTEDL